MPLDLTPKSCSSTGEETEEDELSHSLEMTKNPFFSCPPKNKANKNENSGKDAGGIAKLIATCAASVNRCVELLKRLQQVEQELDAQLENEGLRDKQSNLIQNIIDLVETMKRQILEHVPSRFRSRLLPQGRLEPLVEFPLLFGRCFNLSLNLKILQSGACLDPTITGRVISDLSVLHESMDNWLVERDQLKNSSVVNSMFHGLDIRSDRPRLGFL